VLTLSSFCKFANGRLSKFHRCMTGSILTHCYKTGKLLHQTDSPPIRTASSVFH